MAYRSDQASIWRYRYRVLAAVLLFFVCLFATLWSFRLYHPTGVLGYGLAVLPALPLIGALVVAGIYLAELKDEFHRTLLIESMLWGIGATLAVTITWGYLEAFVRVPHLPLYLICPIFCIFQAISGVLVRLRYR
jgi:hypothetical protein